MSTINEALDALACPRCGGALTLMTASETAQLLICEKCRGEYPIRDGVLDFLSPLDNKTNP